MPSLSFNPAPLNGLDSKTAPTIVAFFQGITYKQVSSSFFSREQFLSQYLSDLIDRDTQGHPEFDPYLSNNYLTSTSLGIIPYQPNHSNNRTSNKKQPKNNTKHQPFSKDNQMLALVCANDQFSKNLAQHVIFLGTDNPVYVFGDLAVVITGVPPDNNKRNNIIKSQQQDASTFNSSHTSITIGPINKREIPSIHLSCEEITSNFTDITAAIPTIMKTTDNSKQYGIQLLCRKNNTTTIRQNDPDGFQSIIFHQIPSLAPPNSQTRAETSTTTHTPSSTTFTNHWDRLGTSDNPRWIAVVWGKGGQRAVAIGHWNKLKIQVHGVSGAVYKGFPTYAAAMAYVTQHYPQVHTEQDIVEKLHKTTGLHSTNLSGDLPDSLLGDTRISRRLTNRIEYPSTIHDT
eukprot:scaffold8865_cov62-Cyclotella_meneghiniana.AAC.1